MDENFSFTGFSTHTRIRVEETLAQVTRVRHIGAECACAPGVGRPALSKTCGAIALKVGRGSEPYQYVDEPAEDCTHVSSYERTEVPSERPCLRGSGCAKSDCSNRHDCSPHLSHGMRPGAFNTS